MGERVAVPQSFWDALAGKIQEDGSFRAAFAVSAIKPKPEGGSGKWQRKQDVYFQWARLDEHGEKIRDARNYVEMWTANWTKWDGQIEKYGVQLELLFAPALGERNVYISIYIPDAEGGAIYAERGRDEEHPWLKLEPEGYDIWLHRPKWDNMSEEQQEAWNALGKPEWVNMFTCLGGDPFATQEEQPVAVGAGTTTDDDMMEL